MTTIRTNTLPFFALAVASWAALGGWFGGGAFAQNHGDFLPTSLNFGSSITGVAWSTPGNNLPSFVATVTQAGTAVGTIDFSYDTWTGNYTYIGITAGAGIAGGFFMNHDTSVVPGFQLDWVQVILPATTLAGNNAWNAPNGSAFPDTVNTRSPAYPFQSLPVTPAVPPGVPTVAMYDYPDRFAAQGNQTWRAELGLVALDPATAQARIIGTFVWGFGVTGNPAGVTAAPPLSWGAASSTFDATLASAFSGSPVNGVTGTAWTFDDDPADFSVFAVPEPGALALFVLGCASFGLPRGLRFLFETSTYKPPV